MICKCGCGEEFIPSKATMDRIKKGQDGAFKVGHHQKGKLNSRWLGGRFVSVDGYVYILMPNHPNALAKGYTGYVAEHRLVMSEHIGRPLSTHEIVHHKNGIRSDNRIENLEIEDRASHAHLHTGGDKNGNWTGGRTPIVCHTCQRKFLPKDRRNDYGAKYCSRHCFYKRENG